MCQDNCNINELKNKPLTGIELGKIESKLDEGKNATQIAEDLGREASTIQKEIKNFSTIVYTRINCSYCKRYESCKQNKLCGYSLAENRCESCRDCKVGMELCKEYEAEVKCKRLKGRRKTCNSCPKRLHGCGEPRLIYKADEAAKQHEKNKKNSVKKYKAIENTEYMDELSKKIKRGISPEVALVTTGNKYGETISLPTLYLRIDRKKMKCTNMDLRNKLKRKPKEEEKEERNRDASRHRANGRSYADLTEEEKTERKKGIGQMDTVIGTTGGKVLLTLLNKQTSFLFGIPITNRKNETIIKEIDKLEITIEDKFKLILEKIVTDNGVEFLNYEGIEKSAIDGEKRVWLYYADPYASYEKGMIENQHRLIRYFFPKGTDFSKYKDEQIIDKMNRINNYPRKDLGWSTPYKEMEKILGTETLEKLGFYYISIEELNMTRKKVA